jgi:predicted nucleic acid-binding Zn ribbon protein
VARRPRDDSDDEPDDWDGSDEYDAERDYDPDDPETYPEGLYDDDGPPTVQCPYCRADILEDSEQCPKCGKYLSREDAPARSRGGAWVIVLILALLAVAMWVGVR